MEDAPLPDFFDSQAKPTETAASQSTPKPERQKRGPKPGTKKKRRTRAQPIHLSTLKPAEAAAPVTPAAPKPERQKRGPNKKPRQARSAKIELSVAFHALTGLSLDEAKIMASITSGLQQVPKKSRGRVVAALAKLFA